MTSTALLEVRIESVSALSNCLCSFAALRCWTHAWVPPDQSQLGSGFADCVNAHHSLRCPGVEPELLGFLYGLWALWDRIFSVRRISRLAAWRASGTNVGAGARHCLGARPLLCRRHRVELDIFFRSACYFFKRGHDLFSRGSTALAKA